MSFVFLRLSALFFARLLSCRFHPLPLSRFFFPFSLSLFSRAESEQAKNRSKRVGDGGKESGNQPSMTVKGLANAERLQHSLTPRESNPCLSLPRNTSLAPGTCCQGASVFPNWSASTPACSQQAVPSPVCVNLNVDTRTFFLFCFLFFGGARPRARSWSPGATPRRLMLSASAALRRRRQLLILQQKTKTPFLDAAHSHELPSPSFLPFLQLLLLRKLRFLRQRVRKWGYVLGRTVHDSSGEFVHLFFSRNESFDQVAVVDPGLMKISFSPNKKIKIKGSYVDNTDPNAPEIFSCPAEFYCPGGTTVTPIPCPPGTGTLGSTGASSVDQCVPQDPCVPDPNTCCRGPTTQPGWPQYGPYFCAGVGGLCTNTAVDKNVSRKKRAWGLFFSFDFGNLNLDGER